MNPADNKDYNRKKLKAIKAFKRKQWRIKKHTRLAEERKEVEMEMKRLYASKQVEKKPEKKEVGIQANSLLDQGTSRSAMMVRSALNNPIGGAHHYTGRKRVLAAEIPGSKSMPKQPKVATPGIRELEPSLLRRCEGIPVLGSGTFGTCYLGSYKNNDQDYIVCLPYNKIADSEQVGTGNELAEWAWNDLALGGKPQ
ncbi:hypothetical protein QZH41_000325 [Actinostola sp. cb2023]|nr:hypothetical protein QZH41_000325 [Actinostola sp. cb2023]